MKQELDAYRAYYQAVHQQPIEEPELLREILRTFLDSDRQFRKWQTSNRS